MFATWTTEQIEAVTALLSQLHGLGEVIAIALCTIAGIFLLRLVILGKNQRTLFVFCVMCTAAVVQAAPRVEMNYSYGLEEPNFSLYDYLEGEGVAMGHSAGFAKNFPVYWYDGAWWGIARFNINGTNNFRDVTFRFTMGGDGQPHCHVYWATGEYSNFVYASLASGTNNYVFAKNLHGNTISQGPGTFSVFLIGELNFFGPGGGSGGEGSPFPVADEFDHEDERDGVETDALSNIETLRLKIMDRIPNITFDAAEVPAHSVVNFGYSAPAGTSIAAFNYNFAMSATAGTYFDTFRLATRNILMLVFAFMFLHSMLRTLSRW